MSFAIFLGQLSKALREGGIDTLKIRKFLEENIDEEKIRNSPIDFGLVTICLSDKEAQELYIDDIEPGKLVEYIMASSSLPVFKTLKIGDKQYLDGGMYDNCPVHMLEKKGYHEVIAIRTYKRMRIRDYHNIIKRNQVTIRMIQPTDRLTNILNFDSKAINRMLQLGYYDGLRFAKKLDGCYYYIKHCTSKEIQNRLDQIPFSVIQQMATVLKFSLISNAPIMKTLRIKILPHLAYKIANKQMKTEKEGILTILEHVATQYEVERFLVYDSWESYIQAIQKAIGEKVGRTKYEKAMNLLIKSL